jgi:DinB superfamily
MDGHAREWIGDANVPQYVMPKHLAELLEKAIDAEFPRLQAIGEADAGAKDATAWSRKEELGHLIDSASNNHLRFVRAALEPEYSGPSYDQNGSVRLHGYQDLGWRELLDLWHRYNHLLVQLIARIPEQKLETRCRVGDSTSVTLEFLIEDYVAHMQHHLDHILRREKITAYPGAALGV